MTRKRFFLGLLVGLLVYPLDAHGHIPPVHIQRWQRSRQVFLERAPTCKLLAWLGAPNAAYLGNAEDTLERT